MSYRFFRPLPQTKRPMPWLRLLSWWFSIEGRRYVSVDLFKVCGQVILISYHLEVLPQALLLVVAFIARQMDVYVSFTRLFVDMSMARAISVIIRTLCVANCVTLRRRRRRVVQVRRNVFQICNSGSAQPGFPSCKFIMSESKHP